MHDTKQDFRRTWIVLPHVEILAQWQLHGALRVPAANFDKQLRALHARGADNRVYYNRLHRPEGRIARSQGIASTLPSSELTLTFDLIRA